jgi:hypothetical protein
MRFKDLILLPAVVIGLTAASTSCYGGSANDRNNNDNGVGINNRQAPNPNGNGSIPTTSSTYSSSQYSGTTNTKGSTSTNGAGSSSQCAPGKGCSTTDLSVFEEADEENVYGDHGFTRGDIKNLYVTKYDPKSEQTINGNVQKILRVQFPDGNCYFVAVIQMDTGTILVNLGPVWFADENNMVVNEGDQVQVVGSLIRTNGRYILIASQLKKDGQSLQLRNQSGSPQWGAPKSQKGTSTQQ